MMPKESGLSAFVAELRRRRIFRIAAEDYLNQAGENFAGAMLNKKIEQILSQDQLGNFTLCY